MSMHLVRTLILGIAVSCVSMPLVATADPLEETSPSNASDASDASDASERGTARCGHVSEMIAARAALVAGDKKEALVHLKEARRRLVACEQQLVVEGDVDESISI